MSHELFQELMGRVPDPATYEAQDLNTIVKNPANWKQGAMPAPKGLSGLFNKVLRRNPTTPPTLPPEFAPVGGEAAYNAIRPVPPKPDLLESVYQRLLSKGGK